MVVRGDEPLEEAVARVLAALPAEGRTAAGWEAEAAGASEWSCIRLRDKYTRPADARSRLPTSPKFVTAHGAPARRPGPRAGAIRAEKWTGRLR